MTDPSALGPWIKRFLLEYLPGERNFTRNTQQSYRDALRLLIVFASVNLRKKPDQLLVDDIVLATHRGCAKMQRFNAESAIGGNPRPGDVHCGTLPRAPALVCCYPSNRVQARRPRSCRVPGKERNGRPAECARQYHSDRNQRPCLTALHVQLWSQGKRGRAPECR